MWLPMEMETAQRLQCLVPSSSQEASAEQMACQEMATLDVIYLPTEVFVAGCCSQTLVLGIRTRLPPPTWLGKPDLGHPAFHPLSVALRWLSAILIPCEAQNSAQPLVLAAARWQAQPVQAREF